MVIWQIYWQIYPPDLPLTDNFRFYCESSYGQIYPVASWELINIILAIMGCILTAILDFGFDKLILEENLDSFQQIDKYLLQFNE